ncbi:MAG: acyl-CoA thioesterase [Lentisphaeria bacterium]|nr:acyl-CoA thioesterase [Lentisphaeria bacterium]
MSYRVPYADTDQMGVVYYANYLEYFERSRTEMLREAGLSYRDMEKHGYFLPVSEAYCKYTGSARYDDLLTFRSCVEEISRVKIKIRSEVLRDGKVLVTGFVTLGCVNADFRISRLLPEMVECCKKFMAETEL